MPPHPAATIASNSRRTHSSSATSRSTSSMASVPCVTAHRAMGPVPSAWTIGAIVDAQLDVAQEEIAVGSVSALVISILRALACSATGTVSRSTPLS